LTKSNYPKNHKLQLSGRSSKQYPHVWKKQ